MNRHEKRAAKAVTLKEPALPSLSGGPARCANCANSFDREAWNRIVEIKAKAALAMKATITMQPAPYDEILCCREPQDLWKKAWAWCSHHVPRAT